MNQNPAPFLQASLVSKNYGSVSALHRVNLLIEKGDIYGIVGLSGAGKSTLLRCLAGLISPSSGEVTFRGHPFSSLQKADLRRLRSKMGMIFQHFNLLSSRTVAGNIAYPLEIAGVSKEEQMERVDELLQLVGLSSKKHLFPEKLSGGEKQRVAIARALANRPEILFCDEATSALDPKTTKEILDLLLEINRKLGVTIVLITHDMGVIKRICHKLAVIEGGRIVEEGLVSCVFMEPKHPTTKQFIQGSSHEIPEEFFQLGSPRRKLLRLRFSGKAASEPLIAQMVKNYQVDANILLGWIDRLQMASVGTLIIELTGEPEQIAKALAYLLEQNVHYEVLQKNGS